MDPSDFKILPSRSVLSAGRIVRSGVILPLRSLRRLADAYKDNVGNPAWIELYDKSCQECGSCTGDSPCSLCPDDDGI